jgi:anti-sigma factor RsiW
MNCPAPESLVPHALGAVDPSIALHLEGCPVCQAEVAQIQEVTGALRATRSLKRRTVTPDCLDEQLIGDFVEGRLTAEERSPVVAHLLTCARCRSAVAATGRLLADETVTKAMPGGAERRWKRWPLPLGLAAAAAVVLLAWPRNAGDIEPIPGMREPPVAGVVAPLPIAPRGPAARVDQLVWSSVPEVDRYRLRLYNEQGALLWTAEAADTAVSLPDSVRLSAPATYFWKVEAQTEWQRWASSDLLEFRLLTSER